MFSNDKICDMKTEGTSITVLYIESTSLDDIRKYMRQKKKIAPAFFELCPMVVDFSKIDHDIKFIKDIFDLLKNEMLIPVGVKGVNSVTKEDLVISMIPVYTVNKVNPKKDTPSLKSGDEPDKPLIKNNKPSITQNVVVKKDTPLTKTMWDSVRGGQSVLAKDTNLSIFGSVNENAEIMATGSILIKGTLSGKAAAGIDNDKTATIVVDKFNPSLISIAGVYKILEDIPEDIKGKSVIVYLEDNHLKIKKIGI